MPFEIEFEKDTAILKMNTNDENSFGLSDLEKFNHSLKNLEEKMDFNSLIITGNRDIFSNGLNITALSKEPVTNIHHFFSLFYENLKMLYYFKTPTIASLSGHTLGYGCMIALMCDFRIASQKKFRIGLPRHSDSS